MSLRKKLIIGIGLIVFVVGAGLFFAYKKNISFKAERAETPSREQQNFVPNEVLIKFKSQRTEEEVKNIVDKQLKKIGKSRKNIKQVKQLFKDKPKLSKIYKVDVQLDDNLNLNKDKQNKDKFSEKTSLDSLIDFLSQDISNIEYAEKNYRLKIQAIPNDPLYPNLWGMQKIQAAGAWDQITDASSIKVAVLDTGIDYTQPDITDNILYENGQVVGYDFCNNDSDPKDDHGHGTHVAGTIAATGNNALGVVGVNWRAQLMPVKFLCGNGWGTVEDEVLAISFIVDQGAKIINASYGGYFYSKTEVDVIKYAYDNGVLFIAAAGNDNVNANESTPANINEVIAVAAFGSSDQKAGFSNYGAKIDVAAPGVGILSIKTNNNSCNPQPEGYCQMSGTSMATPHVVGLAALIWVNHPEFTIEQVKQVIREGADDVSFAGWDFYSGHGRINATKALQITHPLAGKISAVHPTTLDNTHQGVIGTASGPNFQNYELAYTVFPYENQTSAWNLDWTNFASSTQEVTDGELGEMDLTAIAPETDILVKLTVRNTNNESYEDYFIFAYQVFSYRIRVYDFVTSVMIPGAEIHISDMQNPDIIYPTPTTDNNGYYQGVLPPGSYLFEVTKDGYIPRKRTVTLSEVSNDPLLDFRLTKTSDAGQIRGIVTDAVTSQPIDGLTIKLQNYFTDYFEVQTTTDTNGFYSFPNLSITYSYGSYQMYTDSDEYINVYDEGITTKSQQTVTLDFNLTKQVDATTINGRIIDSTLEVPISAAKIQVFLQDNGFVVDSGLVTADLDGLFTIPNLPQGTLMLYTYPSGYEEKRVQDIETHAGETITLPDILMQAWSFAGTISGTVRNMYLPNQPLAGAIVKAIDCISSCAAPWSDDPVRLARTDSNGNFTFYKLNPGLYAIAASGVDSYLPTPDGEFELVYLEPYQTVSDIIIYLEPYVRLTKTALSSTVSAGGIITYRLIASYQKDNEDILNVVVTDDIPEGTEYVEGSAKIYRNYPEPWGTYDPVTRTLTGIIDLKGPIPPWYFIKRIEYKVKYLGQ